jgi:multidrug efflux pump subunit AcrA (membrane-fusion protein)
VDEANQAGKVPEAPAPVDKEREEKLKKFEETVRKIDEERERKEAAEEARVAAIVPNDVVAHTEAQSELHAARQQARIAEEVHQLQAPLEKHMTRYENTNMINGVLSYPARAPGSLGMNDETHIANLDTTSPHWFGSFA